MNLAASHPWVLFDGTVVTSCRFAGFQKNGEFPFFYDEKGEKA